MFVKHFRANRQVTQMAARELARMLYADEKRKAMESVSEMKRQALREALHNLNTWGWIKCPYTGEYVQADPKKAETKVINGSLFWINECAGGKVYVNIFVKKYKDETGTISFIPDVIYLNEDEFQRWLKGEPVLSEEDKGDDGENNPTSENA